MGWYQNWASKRGGRNTLLFVAAISGTLSVWIGYKNFLAPWRDRKRLREAEEYANILLKSEK